ncbi:DNA primase large subunit [Cylas formicarius]|uniref:DNA primase large subunit n=1 Tax=Cylas formicarius TaxID=197179 RepID=UPI0029588E75|nr:DNA primase large subunit [Cylas formicarius]
MDTNVRRRRLHKAIVDVQANIYNHDVSLYTQIPLLEISLSEFEELALDRLQLLRIIEQASLKGPKMYSEEWKNTIKEDLLKNNLKKFVRLLNGSGGQSTNDIQARRADYISHFILRLTYCRSEELRRWFLNRELEWFRLRFMVQTPQSILKFLRLNKLEYIPISLSEKERMQNELIASIPGMSDVLCNTSDFYKVPFIEVIPLVKNRRAYLKQGFAYIPMSDLVVCIQSRFRASLSESLSYINHKLPLIDDDRLTDLLYNLHLTYTGKNYNYEANNKDGIDMDNFDNISRKHFPLCMRHLHETLRANHHLKHHSRLQYGLFIKGIGVLYEQAVEFWRQEFTKIMDSTKFDKSYLYNINHQYGKVGNMTNYSPFSCIKIIMNNVGPGEHHGCPFKHWDASVLRQKLNEYGVPSEGVNSIIELVGSEHYQIACTKYFECIHGQPATNIINHPNQYFEESTNLAKISQPKT